MGNNKIFISRMSIQFNLNQSIYPTPLIYVLHSLHGHLDGRQLFIFILKVFRDFSNFIKSGTRAHILGPKWAKVSVPYFAVCVLYCIVLYISYLNSIYNCLKCFSWVPNCLSKGVREKVEKRIGHEVGEQKQIWVAIGCPKVVNPSTSDYLHRIIN